MSNPIITPHGEKLFSLMLNEEYRNKLNNDILELKSWTLTNRQLCDIEMILNGGFSPLDGFMNQNDYNRVCKKMRLENNLLWPIPITLDINNELADKLEINEKIVLRDKEGFALAILTISDIWKPDLKYEAKSIFGTLAFKSPELIFSDAPIKFTIGLVSLEAKLIERIIERKRSKETINKYIIPKVILIPVFFS